MDSRNKTALIAGATGLVGSFLLKELCANDSYDIVYVLTRKPIVNLHPKVRAIKTDFSDLASVLKEIKADDFFCALGTTIKKAGSKEKFTLVDKTYPLIIASELLKQGLQRIFLVSSVGADSSSSNFYLKTKGKLEDELKELNPEALIIARPGMLLGKRNEFRLGELIGKAIMEIIGFLFIGKLSKYRGIEASVVASALNNSSRLTEKGLRILYYDELTAL